VTYGLGAVGQTEPRTAHSYISELEAELAGQGRLGVEEFARRLGQFFLGRFQAAGMATSPGNEMYFLIGGYNEGEAYGRIYEVIVPTRIAPVEQNPGIFGVSWGGQTQIVNRLINGLDQFAADHIKQKLNIPDQDMADAAREAIQLHTLKIPTAI
jgi:hypothetical protein